MSNNTVDRRSSILEMLREKGKISVVDVTKMFDVSDVTIRNDLKRLELDGFLKRIHGGALKIDKVAIDLNLREKEKQHSVEKTKIGIAAAQLVNEGETIFLDSGTTTMEIARNIKNLKNITVITNALNIASELAGIESIEVILTGGILRKKSFSLVGPHAEQMLGELFGDKLFLGVDGISAEYGVTTPNHLEACVNRIMVKHVNEVIVVTDSSKFNKTSLALIVPIDKVHTVITDKGISEQDLLALRAREINVIIVDN